MKKTVIVTGASKGIGAATAILFAQKGYNVVINYNNSFESADILCRSLVSNGFSASIYKANVANKLEVDLMIKETIYKYGSIDVLVNNAGIAYQNLITDTDEVDFDSIIDINLKGVFNCCKAVTSPMVENKCGKIINISSMWGQVGASCETLYSATKAAIIGLTKAMAKELAPSRITVNCVAPGVIDTDMNACYDEDTMWELQEKTPLSRLGTPEDIAGAVYFLASDAADFITGEVLAVNGGFVI